MNSKPINVSLLYGTGSPNPEYREFFSAIENLNLLDESEDPEIFVTQNQEKHPDLVLVDLNGSGIVPSWLNTVIAQLPQTEVIVCSHNRDPDFLIRIMQLRAGGFIPLPLNRAEFLATLDRIRTERGPRRKQSENQVLAVTGTKGGVGTTSIATNLAVALAEIKPGEVILVDLAKPFPQVGHFLDLKCHHTIMDLVNSADNLDQTFVQKIVQKHKSNLDVLLSYPNSHVNANTVPDIGAMGKIFFNLRSAYKWVVVDLGSWPDQCYARVLQNAEQILLVTELTLPNLQNMKITKALFQELLLDDAKVKVLVNHYSKHYAVGLKDIKNIMPRSVLHTLPHEYSTIMEAINQGETLADVAPRSKLWRRLKEVAEELVAQNEAITEAQDVAKPGLLRRIFSLEGRAGHGMVTCRY
jgi:pilus assembly protein CpaE